MRHFKIIFEPDGRQVTIHSGATLLEAAGHLGIVLNTVCGGKGICGKCILRIEPSGHEVLACQYRIESDLTVTVPHTSGFFEQKILEHGIDVANKFQPDVYKKHLQSANKVDALGIAVDIGTTTVVAKLINLCDGKCLAAESDYNPQMRHGDDVVSRIAYADDDAKLQELQKVIINCINSLIIRLCKKAAVKSVDIYELSVVGNTTMNHILLGFPVKQLGQAPYKAYSLKAHDLIAKELGIAVNPDANIHFVENIAGFVGSDTTASALAVEMNLADKVTLLVDIGTNGEIVLGTKNKLCSASCAAGPAFEGARISQGSRAVDGAVQEVVVNDEDIDIDVIGGCDAISICGSGLIDAVSVMLELGIIESSGRFVEKEKLEKLPSKIFERIITKNSQPAFVLAYKFENTEPSVVLTQKDIREVQLAKAAIHTGICLLLKKMKLNNDDIEQVYLAGAFGNYIRKSSALRIGLLPKVAVERIHFVGNAASSGAHMILISSEARELSGQLARKIEYVEIANEPHFSDIYAQSISF